jgi:hypothetical protein
MQALDLRVFFPDTARRRSTMHRVRIAEWPWRHFPASLGGLFPRTIRRFFESFARHPPLLTRIFDDDGSTGGV